MKAFLPNFISLRCALLLPGLLVLPSCTKKGGGSSQASADSATGFGMADFPYDAAGNYIGTQGSSSSTQDSVPVPNYGQGSTTIASNPTPSQTYGDEAGSVSVVDNTDYSTPTPPSSSSTSSSTYSAPPPPPPKPSVKYNSYRVQRGDTLTNIARRYGTSVSAIMRANNMSGSTIIAGRTIKVPGKAPARSSSSSSGKIHKVQHKQTLYAISRMYGVSVAELQSANGLSGTMIRQGQTLRIP